MRRANLLLALLVVAGAGGCASVGPQPIGNTVEIDGLAVTVEVPKRQLQVGQQFRVLVTVENRTKEAMRIPAASGAPYYIRIWRHTGLAWEEVKRYPEAVTMIMSPWTLEGKSTRTFAPILTVAPDWPTNELLRITAELNGREQASPGVNVEVLPAAGP